MVRARTDLVCATDVPVEGVVSIPTNARSTAAIAVIDLAAEPTRAVHAAHNAGTRRTTAIVGFARRSEHAVAVSSTRHRRPRPTRGVRERVAGRVGVGPPRRRPGRARHLHRPARRSRARVSGRRPRRARAHHPLRCGALRCDRTRVMGGTDTSPRRRRRCRAHRGVLRHLRAADVTRHDPGAISGSPRRSGDRFGAVPPDAADPVEAPACERHKQQRPPSICPDVIRAREALLPKRSLTSVSIG